MKKRSLIITGILGLLVLTFLVQRCIISSRPLVPSGKVTAFFHLYSSPQKENLNVLLDDFRSFYPDIELSSVIEPYQDMRRKLFEAVDNAGTDRAVVTVLTGQDLDRYYRKGEEQKESSPWISTAWRLFYNRDRLSGLGYDKDSLAALSLAGWDEFTETLSAELADNETLFSVGTVFYLPWLVWVQHLELLQNDGTLPTGFSPEEWRDGIDAWEYLIETGFFNPDYRERNMAWSQLAVSDGSALFVLSDTSIFSTYPPKERILLDSVPFPGSEFQKWEVGSNFYLEMIAAEETPDETLAAGELLINYLRSEGVSGRFLQKTGIRLLPADNRPGIKEIPSLLHKSMEKDLQDLLRYLD